MYKDGCQAVLQVQHCKKYHTAVLARCQHMEWWAAADGDPGTIDELQDGSSVEWLGRGLRDGIGQPRAKWCMGWLRCQRDTTIVVRQDGGVSIRKECTTGM